MSQIELRPLQIQGLFVLCHTSHQDSRGRFSRIFCQGSFERLGIDVSIRQINQSRTCSVGTVRGLHFQYPPHAETKIVTCTQGAVWDVAVDLRRDSPTFLKWHGERLDAGDGRSMYIPPGFAHGFQVLVPDSEIIYFSTADYTPSHEAGLSPCDSRLAIPWPLPISLMSARDSQQKPIDNEFRGIEV
jgi:dTDP-4-dehydrorhamnose 3,5-epimerase